MHRECGDNWPDDFDPNDIGLFAGMLNVFGDGSSAVKFEHIPSKSVGFTLALVPSYVRAHRAELSAEEISGLFRAYAQFVAAQLGRSASKLREFDIARGG